MEEAGALAHGTAAAAHTHTHTFGHDLLVSKKTNDSLYRKIQLLTYSKTSEKK
jgi:hypothetical protein